MTWNSLSWSDFCAWLVGKRGVEEKTPNQYAGIAYTELTFSDGTRARMTSVKTEGTPYYSELTPGSSGDLVPPTVEVFE